MPGNEDEVFRVDTGPGSCGCDVSETDSDGDGTPDCIDLCPGDSGKTDPGVCGCGVPDDDSDGDGLLDCLDACPDSDVRWGYPRFFSSVVKTDLDRFCLEC